MIAETTSPTENPIVVDLSPNVTLRVYPKPFSFAVFRDGIRVLSTKTLTGLTLSKQGYEIRSTHVVAAGASAPGLQGLRLRIATENPAIELTLDVLFRGQDRIDLTLRCPEQLAAHSIGFDFETDPDEYWYGADVMSASTWSLNGGNVSRTPFLPTDNQTAPLWLSSRGVAVCKPDYDPLGFSFNARGGQTFNIHALRACSLELSLCVRDDIRQAYFAATAILGKPAVVPPAAYFDKPVYCTWIEFLTEVHQQGVMDYVASMRRSGFDCGVFTIDDKWMPAYGDLEFDPAKFPDPRAMVDSLHRLGLKVALWVTPFIDTDSARYPEALEHGYLLKVRNREIPYLGHWWNGSSAFVDFSNRQASAWFLSALRDLADRYGVDGFKFDAGDASFLSGEYDSHAPMNPLQYTDAFAAIGAEFEINELRVSWLTQKLGLVQRLRDKAPTWSVTDGLGALIPHSLYEGLLGYPYFSADMIGGGWDIYFKDRRNIDEELFVRWTQASALLPIMQFSYAPWKLGARAVDICRQYAQLHETFAPFIYDRARQAAGDGSPIVRALFFEFPGDPQTYGISDQFMLGDRYLVAPVVVKDARSRDIYLPHGLWRDYWSAEQLSGGRLVQNYPADLETLPLFERLE